MRRKVCTMVFAFLLLAAMAAASVTVYITRTGDCYHQSYCSYLSKSKIAIMLEEAKRSGYRPCSRCLPPP